MKLQQFTFIRPIEVDGRALHSVAVGRDGVTELELEAGLLIVARADGARVDGVWFMVNGFGVGIPQAMVSAVARADGVSLAPAVERTIDMFEKKRSNKK